MAFRLPLHLVIKEARDVAAGLHAFKSHCYRDFSAEIGECMYKFHTIGDLIQDLDDSFGYSAYGGIHLVLAGELDLVISSLHYTTETCQDMFGRTPTPGYPSTYATARYTRLWTELDRVLRPEGMDLLGRLNLYCNFLDLVLKVWRRDMFPSIELNHKRDRLTRLLVKQEGDEDYGAEQMSVEPASRRPNRRPISFQYVRAPSPYRPPAYEAPLSPTFSFASNQTLSTSQTYGTGSGSLLSAPRHWASKIFDGRYTLSPLEVSSQTTRCTGRVNMRAQDRLREDGFVQVLELPFEGSTARVKLFWRPSDHRARITFESSDPGSSGVFCMPLTALRILRTDSLLQLCRINREDGKIDLWAQLKFSCYERMVLFYCTAVAMKMQDLKGFFPTLEDFLQPGEAIEYSGVIQHEDFSHALRIYKDADSTAVRLDVTPCRGKMQKCPIWTAFVTEYLGRRRWATRVDDHIIHLKYLQPYVFIDAYTPSRSFDGKFVLDFPNPNDADQFLYVWNTLTQEMISR